MRGRSFSTKENFVQRGKTAGCIANSAYISRSAAIDERTGKRIDYSPDAQRAAALAPASLQSRDLDLRLPPELKDDLGYTEVLLPEGAPERFKDWRTLWNEREAFEDRWADSHYRQTPRNAEKHKLEKAKLAFSGTISLPREFGIDECVNAARRILDEKFVKQGMAIQYAIHVKDGQPHFHYIATSRVLTKDGFKTYATWFDPKHPGTRKYEYQIVHLPRRARAEWMKETRRLAADVVNDISAERGYLIHVEAKSFKDQELSFKPELPVGPGRSSTRAESNSEIREANAEVAMAFPGEIAQEVFANRSVVTEAQLKAAVLDRSTDDASFQSIWRGLFDEGHVQLVGANVKGQNVYTSVEFERFEKQLIATSDRLAATRTEAADGDRNLLSQVVADYENKKTAELKSKGIDKDFKLKDEQRSALEHAAFGGGLSLIQGLPGTGKTTIMEALRLYHEAQSARTGMIVRVRGAATAAVAAENLEREAGIKSTTVAKILHDYRRADELRDQIAAGGLTSREMARLERQLERAERTALRPGDILVVDEAGMVGTRELAELQRRALETSVDAFGNRKNQGASLLYVGDHEQIPSVSAGSAFRALQDRHGAALLADIQRQNDLSDRQASIDIVNGKVEEAVLHYHKTGAITFSENKADAVTAIVTRYMELREQGVKGGLIMTANVNADVDAMNARVRQIRKERGELGEEYHVFGRDIAIGEEIIFTENNSQIGIVQDMDRPVGVLNGYRAVVRMIAVDDAGKATSIGVEIESDAEHLKGRLVTINVDDLAKLNHSYATTLNKAQGQTKGAHLKLLGNESRGGGVVGFTRHRDRLELFGDKETYHNDLRDLIKELSTDRRQENIQDYEARPEKQVCWENMSRFQDVFASYNAEMANATLRAEAEGIEDIRDTEEWKRAQGYREERKELAQLIVGHSGMDQAERDRLWEEHRAFAQQAKTNRWSLEEFAGVRERLMSLREREALETVKNFDQLNRETRALWKHITTAHLSNPHEHPDFERFSNLHFMRGREASIIASDRVTYGFAVNRTRTVTWASITSIAKKYKAEDKIRSREEERVRAEQLARDPAAPRDSIVTEFVSARWRVDALAQLNRMQASAELREQLQEARKEAKAIAGELFKTGRQSELGPQDRARFNTYTHPLKVEPKLMEQERVRIQSIKAMEIAVADISHQEENKHAFNFDMNTPEGRHASAIAVAYDHLNARLSGRIGFVSRPMETYQNRDAQSIMDGVDAFSPEKAREHADGILEKNPQAKEILAQMDSARAVSAEAVADRFVTLDQQAAQTPNFIGRGVNFRAHPIHERRANALEDLRENPHAYDMVRNRSDVSLADVNTLEVSRIRAEAVAARDRRETPPAHEQATGENVISLAGRKASADGVRAPANHLAVENENTEPEMTSLEPSIARTAKLDLPREWYGDGVEPLELPRYGDGKITPAMAADLSVRNAEREFFADQWNRREEAAFVGREPAPFPSMPEHLAAAATAEDHYRWHAEAFRERGNAIVTRYDELALEASKVPAPERVNAAEEQVQSKEGHAPEAGAEQNAATKVLFDRLSPKTKELVVGDTEDGNRSYQGKVLHGLAKDGLSLDEAKAVAAEHGGRWLEKRQFWNQDRTLEQDFTAMWEKFKYEEKYRTNRENFREVDAEKEMSEALQAAPSRNRKEAAVDRAIQEEYSTAEQSWVQNEAAAQELAERTGVKVTPEPVPANPAERLDERAAELVSKFRGETVSIPISGTEEYDHYRSVLEKQEARADRVGDQVARQHGQRVQTDKVWAAELSRDQEQRATSEARIPPTDLPEHLQRAHSLALNSSKMSFEDYRAIAQRAQYAKSFGGMFERNGITQKAQASLSTVELKRVAYGQEMARYDRALKKAGVANDERRLLVVRESKIRAAEMGLDYTYARGRLRGEMAKETRLAANQEARIDKAVQKIEFRRMKIEQAMPERNFRGYGLTEKQEEAYRKAVSAVNSRPVDLRRSVSEIEYGRATDLAKGVAPTGHWHRVSLSTQEMKEVALHNEMRAFRDTLQKEGLSKDEVEKLSHREASYRGASLELKEASLSKALDKGYSVSTRAEHEERIAGTAAAAIRSRSEEGRLAQFDLSPREQAAHDAALKGVRPMSDVELASVVKNHELCAAQSRTADAKDGRGFYAEWENSKLSLEDTKRIALEYETRSYSDNLKRAGVDGWKHEAMVDRERSHRASELGISTVYGRDKEGREQGWNVEQSAAREVRMERLAWGVTNREPAIEPLERASRMSEYDVKRLAYRLEDAAVDRYSEQHGTSRDEARRHVQLNGADLKDRVTEIEQIRRVELQKEQAMDLHRHAERQEVVKEVNSGRPVEEPTLDEKVVRFGQSVAVEKETGPQRFARADYGRWEKETRDRGEQIVKDPAFADRRPEIEEKLKAQNPVAYDRLKEIESQAQRQAQRLRENEQNRQKTAEMSR